MCPQGKFILSGLAAGIFTCRAILLPAQRPFPSGLISFSHQRAKVVAVILALRKLRQEDHECEDQPGLHSRTPPTIEKDPGVVTHTLIPAGETEEDNLSVSFVPRKNSRTSI